MCFLKCWLTLIISVKTEIDDSTRNDNVFERQLHQEDACHGSRSRDWTHSAHGKTAKGGRARSGEYWQTPWSPWPASVANQRAPGLLRDCLRK